MAKLKAHAHPMIALLAHEMAHELYETMMMDNFWYGQWKSKHPGMSAKHLEFAFVRRNIEVLLPQARATLASMLATNIPEAQKEKIMDALVMDQTLVAKRQSPADVIGRLN